MAQECITSKPKTAQEWIDTCLNAIERMKSAASTELPEPAWPKTNATIEEKAASMDEWIEYDTARVLHNVVHGRGTINGATQAIVFLKSMPPLTSRAAAKAFIACLAVGLQEGILAENKVKTLMYTAQLALAAHRPRTRKT